MTAANGKSTKTPRQRTTRQELGRKVTRNISVQFGLIAEVDRIARAMKSKTGLQMDRSKLLGMLSELLLEAEGHLTLEHVYTPQNFKAALGRAIGASARSMAGAGGGRKRQGRR